MIVPVISLVLSSTGVDARADVAVLSPIALGVDAESSRAIGELVREEFDAMGFAVAPVADQDKPCFGERCIEALRDEAKEVATVRIVKGFFRYRLDSALHRTDGTELYRYSEHRWSWAGLERGAEVAAGSLGRRVPGRLPSFALGFRAGTGQLIGTAQWPKSYGSYMATASLERARSGFEVRAGVDVSGGRHGDRSYLDRRFLGGTYVRYLTWDREESFFAGAGAGLSTWTLNEEGEDDTWTGATTNAIAGIILGRRSGVQLMLHGEAFVGTVRIDGHVPAGASIGITTRFGSTRVWDAPVVRPTGRAPTAGRPDGGG